ncbi:kinesin-4-like [Hibiscus syriacus]|uniref:Kinesin-4-like n=1 Tax=Hibiscus syriacus TaxID=106335 RepID=A0A6A2ZCP3_HIBSY|nr:cell division cycle protein 123 homolog [Hibiscus syriacus]XP_039016710.1 cell division cycle protein 123 homolog [Hibiscus syriacus]KAE8689189.1 kinesin-4-like [Hibiscus syriacus]
MKEEEVNRCQIQEWYPKFKSVAIRTLIHELPESFVQYLVDDSGPFVLPVSISNEDAFPNRIHNPDEEEDYQVSEVYGDEAEPSSPPSFPELELKIKESIEALGGAIFPKLNWSAPKDSAWISTSGTLRCTTFTDIALLLRASDSLIHDLCHAYDSCSDKTISRPPRFFLALRKWYPSLRPEMEFRCFVRGQKLVGISQREVTTFYPVLCEKKNYLQVLIEEFFNVNVRLKFESDDYTFDVYVTEDERVKVLDFNPWGAFTLPLLFTWDELEQNPGEGNYLNLRIVESQCAVRPGLKTAVPYDYLDVSEGSGWDQFLRNADDELRRQAKSPEAGA